MGVRSSLVRVHQHYEFGVGRVVSVDAFDCCWKGAAEDCASGGDLDEAEALGSLLAEEAEAPVGSKLRDGDGGFELAALVPAAGDAPAPLASTAPVLPLCCCGCCTITSLIVSCAKPMRFLSSGDSFGATPEFYANKCSAVQCKAAIERWPAAGSSHLSVHSIALTHC